MNIRKILFLISTFIISYILIELIIMEIYYKEMSVRNRLKKVKIHTSSPFEKSNKRELSFIERVVEPLIDNIIAQFSKVIPFNYESQLKVEKRLLMSGSHKNPKKYMFKVAFFCILGSLVTFILYSFEHNIIKRIIYSLLIGLIIYLYFRVNLSRKIKQRQEEIMSQLSSVIDIINVSVLAGLSFDQSLHYITEKTSGALIDEFNIAKREISLGRSRKVALSNLAYRCDIDELTAFISSINQAYDLGISLSNILASQSDMIRTSYEQSMQERAAEIPIKILLPLVLFIFPVIFLILLGPALPIISEILGGI